ncbi:MAG: glycosyl hydrolase 115 family protein [Opitutaceae bacterium]|nr:glycosyl hydrolase 115 family protein [Opitutaceae bacterium]
MAPVWIALAAMEGLAASASAARFERAGVVRLATTTEGAAIDLALVDLAADLERVLGTRGVRTPAAQADVVVSVDPRLGGAEAWHIEISPERVVISGGDLLGAVHGIYAFSERALGVDPLWFWKGMPSEGRERIALAAQTWMSPAAKFRYRGWFINDEDLLTEFGTSGGPRHIDYPFYSRVIDYAIADRIFECLLRLGGNLIIPASFVNILNPPEAELVRRAADRGLYVSQHHVEPMGVSHFGFENFWRERGQEKKFSYSTDPEAVRTVWRAHAKRWREIAGDRVIWQLGMRGRGDRPIWIDDKNIRPETGGEFISRAMADQAAIVREVDPRDRPPMTATLFLEGAELMASGALRFPDGLTVVFADHGPTQELQRDFETAPRLPDYTYGVYYHVAFWRQGPHLVQGVAPSRIVRTLRQLEERGDTAYAIVNVSNIREHALGAHVFIRAALHSTERPLAETLVEFAPAATLPFMNAFHAALPKRADGVWIQDGDCVEIAESFLRASSREAALQAMERLVPAEQLEAAARALDAVGQAGDLSVLSARWRGWTRDYYLTQAAYLAELYRMSAALRRNDVPGAIRHLESSLAVRAPLATGPWEGWYVGDRKANWPGIFQRLRQLDASPP